MDTIKPDTKAQANLRIIIFDLHETLAFFTINYEKMRVKLSNHIGKNFDRIMETVNTLDSVQKKQALEIIDSFEMESLKDLRLAPNADKVIKKARQRNYRICLVTLQGRVAVHKILTTLNIDKFDYIVTRDELTDRKEQIRLCINHFRVKPREVIVIGDKENDYYSANALGCRTFLVKKRGNIPYITLGELITLL